jgi:hypothetical protein
VCVSLYEFVFAKRDHLRMAWRFKASKYKNAAPIVPKPEACIRDISVGSYQTYGNNIAASAAFMAFNVDHNGTKHSCVIKFFATACIYVMWCLMLFSDYQMFMVLARCSKKCSSLNSDVNYETKILFLAWC